MHLPEIAIPLKHDQLAVGPHSPFSTAQSMGALVSPFPSRVQGAPEFRVVHSLGSLKILRNVLVDSLDSRVMRLRL